MATITITVPDRVEDIPAAISDLEKQLVAVNSQRDAILGAIKAVRAQCTHPHKRSYKDVDGPTGFHCPTCGASG